MSKRAISNSVNLENFSAVLSFRIIKELGYENVLLNIK